MKCKVCGKDRFIGHQMVRADVLVDGSGEYCDDLPGGLSAHIYDHGNPYGPFTCISCGAEYEELDESQNPMNFWRKNIGVWIRKEEGKC